MDKEERNNPYSGGSPYAWSNPYAVPESEITLPPRPADIWIEKNFLVVPRDWEGPEVCLLTGATADLLPRRGKWLTWASPVWYLLIFILGFLALLVIALLQRKGRIYYYISRSAAAEIRKRRVINLCLFAIGLLMVILSFPAFAGDFKSWLVLPGLILLLTSGVLAATWCRPFYARRISRTHIWIAKIPARVRTALVEMERTAASRPWM